MKAAEWIDRVKMSRGWETDYRAAKELGVHRNTLSNYRTKTPTLDEDMAIKVAQALGVEPAAVIIDQVAERSKDQGLRTALQQVAAKAGLYIMLSALGVVKKSRIQPRKQINPGFAWHFPPSGPLTA
jgi:transcriptional regulator with XRE-family HTH domain